MRNFKAIFSVACCSVGLLLMSSVVRAAPMDPSGGQCSGLDASSSLLSTCIQAHSARNRTVYLSTTRASANAVQEAQSALNTLLAQFASLGGGVVPGFEPACPCWNATELASIDGSSPSGAGSRLQCVASPGYLYSVGETAYTVANQDQSGIWAEVRVDNKSCRFSSTSSTGTLLASTFIENLSEADANTCAARVQARILALGISCAGGT